MRKIYSLIASALLMLPAASFAQTMTEENQTLEELGYRLEKDVNFRDGFVNGKEIVPNNGLTFSGVSEDPKINGWNPQRVTNEGLEWLSIQLPGNNIDLLHETGLRSVGNERWIGVNNLRVGQIIVIDISNTDPASFVANSIECNGNTGWADNFCDPLIVAEISDSIHSLQDLGGGETEAGDADEAEEGEGEEVTGGDTYRYFKVINAGTMWAKFNGKSPQNIIYRLQIWSDNTEAEVVSAPSLKIVGVDGADRQLEFKPGESTYGNVVKTYYSTDGEDPIYLKESDEIDYVEIIYARDEEGNIRVDEAGDSIIEETINHYKKVLDMDLIETIGAYGDNEYEGNGSITIYGYDDKDGDGIVEVKAASVCEETGVVSEVVAVNVAVGDIQLNAPTLTLYGFDGKSRSYSIGWVNNTICEEEYTFVVEGDGGELYDESLTIGDIVNIESDVTVTVSAKGYLSGELTIAADYQGVDIHRKSADEDTEGNPLHDWDFTNLTDAQKAIVQGTVIEGYYVITEAGDSLTCSYEDYIANDGVVNGVDFTEGTEIYAPTCWWWDGGNQRATLNVDTLGNNLNANGFGYVDDTADIFHDMLVNCAPNDKNNSCIFIYIGRANGTYGNLGAYFMARPEFTFPRSVAAAGEFVLIQGGTGGSNWTNAPYPIIKQVPEDGLLTVNGLPGNGYHVFYIDVYTYDNLPEDQLANSDEAWEDALAIEGVSSNGKAVAGFYTLSGAKLSAPQKGINIVKYADGTAAKVLVK